MTYFMDGPLGVAQCTARRIYCCFEINAEVSLPCTM